MKILRLESIGIEKAAKEAAKVLQKGGIVLYPTDTLYGLAVDAGNSKAVATLRALKGREQKKPISVVVPNIETLDRYVYLNQQAKELAQKFFPGALTLVAPATTSIARDIVLNDAVGIRIPNSEFCLALGKAFKRPFTATSANRSGRENPTGIAGVIEQFGHEGHVISLVIDGGYLMDTTPSTVVSCISDTPHILREGAISREELGL